MIVSRGMGMDLDVLGSLVTGGLCRQPLEAFVLPEEPEQEEEILSAGPGGAARAAKRRKHQDEERLAWALSGEGPGGVARPLTDQEAEAWADAWAGRERRAENQGGVASTSQRPALPSAIKTQTATAAKPVAARVEASARPVPADLGKARELAQARADEARRIALMQDEEDALAFILAMVV